MPPAAESELADIVVGLCGFSKCKSRKEKGQEQESLSPLLSPDSDLSRLVLSGANSPKPCGRPWLAGTSCPNRSGRRVGAGRDGPARSRVVNDLGNVSVWDGYTAQISACVP